MQWKALVDSDTLATAEGPQRRAILLGASNLTRGISTVVETSRRVWGWPLEILAAMGHGRSYGATSRFLWRELPGIRDCGLWDSLARGPRLPTAALVTDIGNDLLYGSSVDAIAGWVGECFERLAAAEARTVVTLLPLANLPTLSERRFRFFRALFVPGCDLNLETLIERAGDLNERVREMAAAKKIFFVEQPSAWYGFDPIHHKPSCWPRIWREILAAWSPARELPESARPSILRSLYLRTLKPHERRWLGRQQRRAQPAGRLRDGTTVSLF